ncbi:MAG: HEPN domain-containing protein [Gaiellaceae bacterium]
MRNWFAKQARLKPVFNLFFGMRYHPNMYLDVAFLAYAQAVETYDYRRRQKPGNKTLAQRMADVLSECRTVSKRIVGMHPADQERFIDAFRTSRNYYTHYNAKLEKKASRGAALLLLSIQLQAITEMSLLRELGFPCHAIDKILERVRRYEEIEHFKAIAAEEEAGAP